jgi:hypothetical protein
MSFRFFQPGTQFFTNDGLVLAGGSLTFTDSGTSDPRTTWSDPGMSVENSDPVELDGAGRPDTDIWGDGSYRVVIKDSLGATIDTLDDVSGPFGIPDPALEAGKFLTNDGVDVSWAAILQVPDATGATDGWVLTTDGAGNFAWEVIPTSRQVPDPSAIADGWVLTRDDASPGDYAWMAPVSALGVGQTWTTPARSLNTQYTNSSGRPIQVAVCVSIVNSTATFLVSGVTVAFGTSGAGVENISACVVVPDGATYEMNTTGPTIQLDSWAELS